MTVGGRQISCSTSISCSASKSLDAAQASRSAKVPDCVALPNCRPPLTAAASGCACWRRITHACLPKQAQQHSMMGTAWGMWGRPHSKVGALGCPARPCRPGWMLTAFIWRAEDKHTILCAQKNMLEEHQHRVHPPRYLGNSVAKELSSRRPPGLSSFTNG